jgi:hypothetical protein
MTIPATLATAYAHGPGKQIRTGAPTCASNEPGSRTPLAELAALGAFAADVARLVVEATTPQRWEPWNPYNDHRAHPSPRAAHLIDIALVTDGGRWMLDAVRRALIGHRPPGIGGTARLEFCPRPDRLSDGYGEFANALVALETGHVTEALADTAGRLGLDAIADRHGMTLRPGTPRTPPGALPVRSSGIGPYGLSVDPRPLPAEDLRAFLEAIGCTDEGMLTHRLAVHNVTGLADGWHTVDSTRTDLAGDAMGEVQRAFGYPRSTIDVAGMNLAVVMTADISGAVAAHGPHAYWDLLRAAGRCAQRACSAAAAVGMFCRPVRSVDDPALEAAAGVPLSHSLLYVLLAGRSRVHCFPYDLTPLELP